jgi:hypothetical protein
MQGTPDGAIGPVDADFDVMTRPTVLICGHGDGVCRGLDPRLCSHSGEKPAA